MSAQAFEIALARLYTDPAFRTHFLRDPEKALQNCELSTLERSDLIAIDRAGLLMASRSFHHKRKKRFLLRCRANLWTTFIANATKFMSVLR